MSRQHTRESILALVDTVTTPDGCHLWTRARSKGYGVVRFGGKHHRTHRLIWQFAYGPIPDGLHVLHNCPGGDNPACCNVKHLWLGTNAENMADMAAKGRAATGDRNGSRLYPERLPRGDRSPARLHPENMARGDRHGSHTQPERIARGDRHGSRLHPERLARGDRNGVRLHPETLARGDRHGSRTHPERIPRGDHNGSRTHPELLVRGEQVNTSKLTASQVVDVRQRYDAGGVTLKELATEYGISGAAVWAIIRRKSWAHVP